MSAFIFQFPRSGSLVVGLGLASPTGPSRSDWAAEIDQLRCGVSVVVLSNAGRRGTTTRASFIADRIVRSVEAIDNCRGDV